MANPKVHLSSIPSNLRPTIIEKVEALYGIVLDPHHNQYNEQCSHLLVCDDNTKPTERVLAALAAGIWIVRVSWVERSYLMGFWVSEEPHECMVGRGLPRYHRLRAKAAIESPDQSCALPSLAKDGASAASKVKSGGIFSGWTMCVRVKKSTDNRSFRRVLGAAGAVVVSSSDLAVHRDRLNLVLCDHESVGVLRQVLGPCTPIAHHYFLRDVLLQRVDPANIQPYIYPANNVPMEWQSHRGPNLPRTGSSSQPLVVDVSGASTPKKPTPNTPNLSRRPATLRRRNRITTTTAKNTSITDYFSPSKSCPRVQEIVILDEPMSNGRSSRKLFSDVITLSDDEDDFNPLKKSKTSSVGPPKAEVNLADSDGEEIEVVMETTSVFSRKMDEKKNPLVSGVSYINSEVKDVWNGKSVKPKECSSVTNQLPLQPNLANRKMNGKPHPNGQNSSLSAAKPELNNASPKKENFTVNRKTTMELMAALKKSFLKQSGSENCKDFLTSGSSSYGLSLKRDVGTPSIVDGISVTHPNAMPALPAVSNGMPAIPAHSNAIPARSYAIPAHSNAIPALPVVSNAIPALPVVSNVILGLPAVSHVISGLPAVSNAIPALPVSCNIPAINSVSNAIPVITSVFSAIPAVSNAILPLTSAHHTVIASTSVSNIIPASTSFSNVIPASTPVSNILAPTSVSQAIPVSTSVSNVILAANSISNGIPASTTISHAIPTSTTISHAISASSVSNIVPASTLVPGGVHSCTSARPPTVKSPDGSATLTSTTPAVAAATDTGPVVSGTTVSPTSCEQGHSNGKIPHWLTMNMVGKFLENSYSNREILSSSLNRSFPTSIDPSLVKFCRVQRNTEASLYWASINQTNLLGIDISSKNTFSALGGAKPQPTHGNQSNGDLPNGGSQERSSAADENDVEVVINSLLWLRLHMTPLHFPDQELIGDMLARYVINSGVPHVQSQAVSVAHHLLALRPPCAASRCYYIGLLSAAAATVSGKKEVPLSDITWSLVERVSEGLGVPQDSVETPSTAGGDHRPSNAPRGLTFERWQYEQHLLDFLAFVFSVLDLDISHWKSKAGPAVPAAPVEELIGFRLLFGFSSNPSVLPKSCVRLLKLWCGLAPAPGQPGSWRRLRACCSRLVALLLELVWLYHAQHTTHKSDKKKEDLYSSSLSAKDSRFTRLATDIAVLFAGMPFVKVLNLVREVPLSRHRFFLTNLLRSACAPSLPRPPTGAPGTGPSVPSNVLQDLVQALIEECRNCSTVSSSSSFGKSADAAGECTRGELTHADKTLLLFMNILAYIQVTGAVYVVKKAASESLKRKRGTQQCGSETVAPANDSSNSSASLNQSDARTEPSIHSGHGSSSSSGANGMRNNQVFYDGFGKAISKEYLNVCCARFSVDRKLLTAKQADFVAILGSCGHISVLKLLLYLLYFKF